jgi:aconitase B
MATRTTESTNTLETFRVNFNGLVTDIGDVSSVGGTAGDQLSTVAATVVGAINEIFAGFNLASQISGEAANYLQSSNAETLNLIGGTGVHAGSETTNIVTDITADDTMSFLLNDNITGLASLQVNTITPTAGGATDPIVFGTLANGLGTNYNVKFASPGDTNIDYGSTQGFAAAMSVALG